MTMTMDHNAILNRPHDGKSYYPGWYIGSQGENGEHLRDASGWPYSIYRKANATGLSDAVLADNIQHLDDALALASMLNEQR